jgi:Fe-S-cluster containining protein
MKTHLKLLALQAIYSFHEELLGRWSFTCRQGCSTCCTQSVTMTGLEGEHLLGYLQRQQEMGILERSVRSRPSGQPQLTTNQFAAACLQGHALNAEPEGWDLTPCPFLKNNCCKAYQARPFGCRALASLGSCDVIGAANTPPLLLSVNIMLMQVIEHRIKGDYGAICWRYWPAWQRRQAGRMIPCPSACLLTGPAPVFWRSRERRKNSAVCRKNCSACRWVGEAWENTLALPTVDVKGAPPVKAYHRFLRQFQNAGQTGRLLLNLNGQKG